MRKNREFIHISNQELVDEQLADNGSQNDNQPKCTYKFQIPPSPKFFLQETNNIRRKRHKVLTTIPL